MVRLRASVGAVLLAGALCACPPPPGAADAGVDAGDPVSRYCAGYAGDVCGRMADCGISEPGQLATCEAKERAECEVAVGSTGRAGATRLEDGALEACQQALRASSCLLLRATAPVECLWTPRARAPAGALGDPCASQTCAEGVCSSGGGDLCGTCITPPAVGEACGACDPKVAFCNAASRCEVLLADGQGCTWRGQCASGVCNVQGRCGPGQQGERCGSELECPSTHFCNGVNPSLHLLGTCQPRTDAGAACAYQAWDSAGGCALGTFCLDGACVAPDAGSLPEGAQCSTPWQCRADAVCLGLFGRFEYGQCTTPRADGPCLGEQQACAAASRCLVGADGGACHPLRGEGEPCSTIDTRWDDCRVGLACGASGTCQPLRTNGAGCARDGECFSGHCTQGACQPPGADGAACVLPEHCESRICSYGGTGGGVCAPVCR